MSTKKAETIETIETIEVEDVEIINSPENKQPKIKKVKANESVEDFFKKANKSTGGQPGGGLFDNPIMKLMSDPVEMAKAKIGALLIFFSVLLGIIGLFGFRIYMGSAALILGILAYFFGADILKKGGLFGIFLGLIVLTLHII